MSGDVTVLSRTQIVRVNPTSGKVSVINAGPPGPAGDLAVLTGPQNPAGTWSFAQSPIVPNPASGAAGAAVSLDELEERLAGEPILLGADPHFISTMTPIHGLSPVTNTIAKSALSAQLSIPRPDIDWIGKFRLFGTISNSTGSPVTYTFVLDNTAQPDEWVSHAIVLPTGASRSFRWTMDLAVNGLLVNFVGAYSDFVVPAVGALPEVKEGKTVVCGNLTSPTMPDPSILRPFVTMSVANANASVAVYGAMFEYSFKAV